MGERSHWPAPSADVEATLLDDLFLETLDKRDHVARFGLGYLELREGRGGMTKEHAPIALADAHASVGEHHVPAAVVHRSARTRAEEVDQELLLARDAVFPAVRPEAAELRIGSEPGQQIIRHRRDRLVTTKPLVQGLRLVAHRVLLVSASADRSSALHRICEHQAIRRVRLRVIETFNNPWERVFDCVDVAPSLQLQVHVLKARPRALPRCADRPDPLATLDTVPDPNGDLGEVAIDRSEAVRIMVDDDDQTAQVAVVTCDSDAAGGCRQHISTHPACDVDAAMGT